MTQTEINDYCRAFESKIASFLDPIKRLTDEEASKLGLKEAKACVYFLLIKLYYPFFIVLLLLIVGKSKNLLLLTLRSLRKTSGYVLYQEKNLKVPISFASISSTSTGKKQTKFAKMSSISTTICEIQNDRSSRNIPVTVLLESGPHQ